MEGGGLPRFRDVSRTSEAGQRLGGWGSVCLSPVPAPLFTPGWSLTSQNLFPHLQSGVNNGTKKEVVQYKDMLIKHHPNNERVYAAPSHKKSIKTHMISQQAEQVASTHHSLMVECFGW